MADDSKQHNKCEVLPGNTDLLGATFVDNSGKKVNKTVAYGVNFAVVAPRANTLWLCLFYENKPFEVRYSMYKSKSGVWNLLVKNIIEGQAYGFRAHGIWDPGHGYRFNKNKLLMDPYSKEIKGKVDWQPEVYDYYIPENGSIDDYTTWFIDIRDNSDFVPRSIVRDDSFDWEGVKNPDIPSHKCIIYEAHVKGYTYQHPLVPESLKGTYLGLCHHSVLKHLIDLGVNTIELLPVTSFTSEHRLKRMGLNNYWGYNPLVFMAPEPSFSNTDPVRELKTMVRELHRAGIKIIMDVVFNHTCEGGNDGSNLSLRGLASREYYMFDLLENGYLDHTNYSGCGNTLKFDSPYTLNLVLDSLRYWVSEYHIDGFRFDLAPILARKEKRFSVISPFFQAISNDPILSKCQMIAEPWDIGPDGYQLTNFPDGWHEWNDRYRDGIRSFWRGDSGRITDLAWRLAGSVDLFDKQRSFMATVNYICSHDGFTLNDLVSYTERVNWNNGEDNRDGDQHNISWNNGAEGTTDNEYILNKRLTAKKNMIATLMLSQGVPMFMAGDEFENSQFGNNNAYCQDNPVGWLDWSWYFDKVHEEFKSLHSFMTGIISLRKRFLYLLMPVSSTVKAKWLTPEGIPLSASMLVEEHGSAFQIHYISPDDKNTSLLFLINNENRQIKFYFFENKFNMRWYRVLSTVNNDAFSSEIILNNGWYDVEAKSCIAIFESI